MIVNIAFPRIVERIKNTFVNTNRSIPLLLKTFFVRNRTKAEKPKVISIVIVALSCQYYYMHFLSFRDYFTVLFLLRACMG